MLKDHVKCIFDENCSSEDFQYTLYLKSKIEKGQQDINKGHILLNEEVKTRVDRWLNKQ